MLEYKGIKFADTLRVLFELKEKKGHKTLQETYALLQDVSSQLDLCIDILLISYNVAHKGAEVTVMELSDIFAANGIGFMLMTEIYGQLVEKIMFSGKSAEEIESLKKVTMNQKK